MRCARDMGGTMESCARGGKTSTAHDYPYSSTGLARGGGWMNPPLRARLSLIRYQITIATASERSFAIQFFVGWILIFRFIGKKDIGDFVTELLFGQVALEDAVFANRDAAGFLADDDTYGIGAFRDAECGAVAKACGAVLHFAFGDGEHAGRAGDAFVGDDHTSVVERGFREENGHGEFGSEAGVESDAGIQLFLETDIALDGEEGADALFRQVDDGVGEPFQEVVFAPAVEIKQPVTAEASEAGAQFRLKNHDEGKGQHGGGAGDDPLDDLELEDRGEQHEQNEDGAEAYEDLGAAGGAEGFVDLVQADRENQNFDSVARMLLDE